MLDKRQSFEIGVKAAREYRPISSNDFRFVIRGGQRFEARPRKREKSNIEFPPNPLLTRESRLSRSNQPGLRPLKTAKFYGFRFPLANLLSSSPSFDHYHRGKIDIHVPLYESSSHEDFYTFKERNLFPGCISQNYLREKEERSVENRRGKPWLKHCDEYKNSWSILLSATRSVAVKKLTCISLYHLWSSLLPFQAPINHRTHPRPNPLDLAITRYRDPRASRPSNAPTSYKYNVDSIAEVHLPRSIDLSVPGTRYPSSPL